MNITIKYLFEIIPNFKVENYLRLNIFKILLLLNLYPSRYLIYNNNLIYNLY